MLEIIQDNERLFVIVGLVSVISFIATLAFIPWFILRMPADYFVTPRRNSVIPSDVSPLLRIVLLLFINLFGVAILLLGVGMLILPGQGLLTIFIGLILINFPGKYKLQRWLITREPVCKSVNWLRKKGDKAPLTFD
jgi:hypothetical protein